MQEHGTFNGEGFAIAALQCTLIEFLESTEQGINYVYRNADPVQHQDSWSGDVFSSFLTKRRPFAACFDEAAAKSFYEGMRYTRRRQRVNGAYGVGLRYRDRSLMPQTAS